MIPKHLRVNHDNTDTALMYVRGLLSAFDVLHDVHEAPEPNSRASLAKAIVLRLLLEQFDALDTLRSMEWVGLGGRSPSLTFEQIAAARGQAQE